MDKKIRVWMGIPSTGTRSDAQVYALRDIEAKYRDKIELVYPPKLCQRIFHDYARNMTVEEFLKSDCDVIWFLDSDVVPPLDILSLIENHWDNWELAGAPYPVFMTPSGEDFQQVVMCVYGDDGKKLYAAHCPTEGKEFVAGLATGCIFIKREVFTQLQRPYFEFKYDPETRCIIEGEDLGFCKKVNALGYQFFCDYSLVCKHFKHVDLLAVQNYAGIFAKKSVEKYDQQIKPQVENLAAKYRALLAERKPKSSLILP